MSETVKPFNAQQEVEALRKEVAELRNQLANLRSQVAPIILANTRFG